MKAPDTRAHHSPGEENDHLEPPPVLKSWRNIYLLVAGNLFLCIILFYLFTRMFT